MRIVPLTFPHGLPQEPSDFEHCYINSKGELIVRHTLREYEPDKDQPLKKEKWQMEVDTVQKKLKRTLQLYDVHSEYYEPEYEWKKNEDGKEHRYNFSKGARKSQF